MEAVFNVLGKEFKFEFEIQKITDGDESWDDEVVTAFYLDGVRQDNPRAEDLKYMLSHGGSLSYEETEALADLTGKFTVSDYESVDHDCECCGWYTDEYWTLKCGDNTFEVESDGHFGYGYLPTLADIEEFVNIGGISASIRW